MGRSAHLSKREGLSTETGDVLIIIAGPVTIETKSVLFNALPLFAVAAAYAGVTTAMLPAARRRWDSARVDLGLTAVFPAVSVFAVLLGTLVVVEGRPLAGHLWISFAACLAMLVPPVAFLLRSASGSALAPDLRARVAEERSTELGRELGAVTRISTALVSAGSTDEIARITIDEATSLLSVQFGALALIGDDGNESVGVLARADGEDVDWFPGTRTDLRSEPSGTASTVFDAAPLAVYDAQSSPLVSARLVDRVSAKSAAFVPLISEGRVLAVLILATTNEPRAFASGDLAVVQALCNEAALALDRQQSASALRGSLERERLVARIARRFRGELDVHAVLRVAVEETGRALNASRCFVRLADDVEAEWHEPGLAPLGDVAAQMPVSNLAVRRGRTVVVGDVDRARELDDPSLGSLEVLRRSGAAAALAVPLSASEEVLGVFTLHRRTPGPWSGADVTVAEAVAREAAIALHIARLLAENEQRLRHQTALLRAAQQVTSELELDTVLQRLVDEVATLLEVDAADLYLYEPRRRVLRCAAVHGMPPELVGFEFSAERGVAAEAIRRSAPVISAAYEHLSEPVPHPAYEGFSEAIVAPMHWSGETRGVLGAGARSAERRFSETDADVLGAFASLASLALRNAELYGERSRQARIERGFYRIAAILGETLSYAATLDAVAQAAADALGADAVGVLMPQRGDELELVGAHGLPTTLMGVLRAGLPESASVLRLCAGERRVIASTQLGTDERFGEEWRELAAKTGFQALLALPLETPRGEGSGLVLVFSAAPRQFTDDDLELARHLADATRGALERSELYEAERSARALAQQLARTGSRLATELDPAAVLDEVVQRAPDLLAADACAIRVVEGDELVISAAGGADAADLVGSRSAITFPLSGDVYQSRSPVLAANAGAEERYREADAVLAAGYIAYLGVPLVGPEGTAHGVLSLYARRPRTWRGDEIEALNALATNTSAALSNAELFTSVAVDRERSYAILANIADGIVAVDRDGRVVLWNAAAERMTGVPAAEATGRSTLQVLGRELESDGGQPGRLLAISRGSEEVWLSVTEAVMRDPTGAVAGRIFAFRDISADRLVEEMKSEFVATVSHELRGPLTSIYGFAETLLREDVLFGEDERRTFLGYIASESARLTTIVDALLNVARLDTGDLQVNLQPTDVRPIVSEVIEGVEEAIQNGHRFVLDLPEEPLAANADGDKLRQILAALVDNAVKFSPSGGTVTVVARRTSDGVEFRVEDEGVGIPQSEQEWIFRKFYRGGDAAPGTGLGLFIAQELVSAMGGRISVDSAEGKGSRFSFELPAAAGVVEEERPRV